MRDLHLYWFSGSSVFNRVTKRITKGTYSHVAILVNGRFYEANGTGVVVLTGRDIEQRTDKAVAWYTTPLSDAEAQVTRHYLDMAIGQPYSWHEAVLSGASALTGWNIRLNWYARYICSGLAAEAMALNGHKFPKPAPTVNPNELARWVRARPYPAGRSVA